MDGKNNNKFAAVFPLDHALLVKQYKSIEAEFERTYRPETLRAAGFYNRDYITTQQAREAWLKVEGTTQINYTSWWEVAIPYGVRGKVEDDFYISRFAALYPNATELQVKYIRIKGLQLCQSLKLLNRVSR